VRKQNKTVYRYVVHVLVARRVNVERHGWIHLPTETPNDVQTVVKVARSRQHKKDVKTHSIAKLTSERTNRRYCFAFLASIGEEYEQARDDHRNAQRTGFDSTMRCSLLFVTFNRPTTRGFEPAAERPGRDGGRRHELRRQRRHRACDADREFVRPTDDRPTETHAQRNSTPNNPKRKKRKEKKNESQTI
jgi:hypothetical protein